MSSSLMIPSVTSTMEMYTIFSLAMNRALKGASMKLRNIMPVVAVYIHEATSVLAVGMVST